MKRTNQRALNQRLNNILKQSGFKPSQRTLDSINAPTSKSSASTGNGLIEEILNLKDIGSGHSLKSINDDGYATIVTPDGKEKRLKIGATKKGQFVRINNITHYI